jgi:hypothetical protein
MTESISTQGTTKCRADSSVRKAINARQPRTKGVAGAKKWNLKRLRAGDYVLAAALLATAIAWIGIGAGATFAGSTAVVQVGGNLVAQIDLGHEDYITVQGALGPVLIGVDRSGIRILDSQCPNKLCMRMGAIKRAGDWIACVPNKLVIRVGGYSGVDAISPGSTMP